MVHCVETKALKLLFTDAPKMEGEGYYGGTLSDLGGGGRGDGSILALIFGTHVLTLGPRPKIIPTPIRLSLQPTLPEKLLVPDILWQLLFKCF